MVTRPTFLHQNSPLNTCMIQTDRPDIARNLARDAAFDGCDAYGFQYECLGKEYHNEETVRSIFSQMDHKPIYVTNYRQQANAGLSDEELAEGLFSLLRWGATLVDVMGDYYDPVPNQLTMDPEAAARQKDLIARLHDAGGEVLMSSHVMKFTPAEEVLRIAAEQQSRGADLIVNTEKEDLADVLKAQLDAGTPVDVAIDCVGGEGMGKCLPYLARGARWIMIAALAGPITEIDLKNIYVRGIRIIGSTLRSRTPAFKAELLAKIVRHVYPMVEDGRIRPSIYRVLPITQAEEAHALMASGRHNGKIVMTVKSAGDAGK